MATRAPHPARRAATVAAWPLGIALTSWNYLWRTTPMQRHEAGGSRDDDLPPDLPGTVVHAEIIRPEQGVGPLFHRRYRVRIRDSRLEPEQLLARIAADPNELAPSEFARFHKTLGTDGELLRGDEYVVRMPGPWDGPVRVVDRTPTSFRLATLAGHLEAGQIQFSASRDGRLVVFAIESWAASADRLSNLLYRHLRMAKEIQLHMWISFLERVVELSGGVRDGRLEIETRSFELDRG